MSCEECLLRMNDVSTELNSEESIIEIINLVQVKRKTLFYETSKRFLTNLS